MGVWYSVFIGWRGADMGLKMKSLKVTGVVVGSTNFFPMAAVSSLDSADYILNTVLREFRNMALNDEQVMVRVEDRNVMLFKRINLEDEFRIDGLRTVIGWIPCSNFNDSTHGLRFGFIKDEQVFPFNSGLETLQALSQVAQVGVIYGGEFKKIEFRTVHSYEMIGAI